MQSRVVTVIILTADSASESNFVANIAVPAAVDALAATVQAISAVSEIRNVFIITRLIRGITISLSKVGT